jgi:hypothetical protein
MFVCSQTARSHKHTHQLDIGSGWNIQRTKQKRRRRRRRKRKKGSKKDYGQYTWVSHRNVIGFSSLHMWVCVELLKWRVSYAQKPWPFSRVSFQLMGGLTLLYFIFDFIRLALSSYRRILMNCSDMLGGSWDSGAGHPYILGVRSIDPWTRQLAKKRKKKKKIIK